MEKKLLSVHLTRIERSSDPLNLRKKPQIRRILRGFGDSSRGEIGRRGRRVQKSGSLISPFFFSQLLINLASCSGLDLDRSFSSDESFEKSKRGSRCFRVSLTTQLIVPEIIRQQDNDIRLIRGQSDPVECQNKQGQPLPNGRFMHSSIDEVFLY